LYIRVQTYTQDINANPLRTTVYPNFHHNGNLITEQGTGEQTPLFQLAVDAVLTSQMGTIPTPHSDQLQLSHNRGR